MDQGGIWGSGQISSGSSRDGKFVQFRTRSSIRHAGESVWTLNVVVGWTLILFHLYCKVCNMYVSLTHIVLGSIMAQ